MTRTLETPTLGDLVKSEPHKKTKSRKRYDLAKVRVAAAGHWHRIIPAITTISDDYLSGQHGECPMCGGGPDADRWRTFGDFSEVGGAVCNQCGKFADGFSLIQGANKITLPEAIRLVAEFHAIPENTDAKPTASKAKTKKTKARVDAEDETAIQTAHLILSQYLQLMKLADDHLTNLRARGLTDEAIAGGGFATLDRRQHQMAVMRLTYEHGHRWFHEVPGFREGTGCDPRGLLVPVRDREGRIRGLQIRLDEHKPGGSKYIWMSGIVSPGAPTHFSAGCNAEATDSVRLTEGALKAAISHCKTGIPAIAIAGVGLWQRGCEAILCIQPKRVLVALDSDWRTNPAVHQALRGMADWLREHEISFAIEVWDPANKGIDDCLAVGGAITEVSDPDEIDRMLDDAAAAGDGGTVAVDQDAEKPVNGTTPSEFLIAADDPFALAKANLVNYRASGRDIRFWRGNWYTWKGKTWAQQTETYVRSRLREFVEQRFSSLAEEEDDRRQEKIKKGEVDEDKIKPVVKRKTTSSLVANVLGATETLAVVPDQVEMQSRLSDRSRPNILAVSNGLINLDLIDTDDAVAFVPHTSDWFSDHCSEYDLDINAQHPHWSKFLNEVFLDREKGAVDSESIEALQRWFGYCLMPSTALQKMLVLDGVSRSGKSTITRVLRALIGEKLTASPKLRDLAGDFGLQPLIGKKIAIIGDARLDYYRHDVDGILETLLGIIGEDSVDINKKRVDVISSQKLNCKFTLACNGIPVLNDPSMAIVNRLIVLKFSNSFLGAEDPSLTEKLLSELSAIFNWSLLGVSKMMENFFIVQPANGAEVLENFRKQIAPVRQFVEEHCYIQGDGDPAHIADRDTAFLAWQAFCEKIGKKSAGTKSSFVRQLCQTYPQVKEHRPGSGRDGRERRYQLLGIELGEWARKVGAEKPDAKPDAKLDDNYNEG